MGSCPPRWVPPSPNHEWLPGISESPAHVAWKLLPAPASILRAGYARHVPPQAHKVMLEGASVQWEGKGHRQIAGAQRLALILLPYSSSELQGTLE